MISELLRAVLHFLCFCVSLDHFSFVVSKLVLFTFFLYQAESLAGKNVSKMT